MGGKGGLALQRPSIQQSKLGRSCLTNIVYYMWTSVIFLAPVFSRVFLRLRNFPPAKINDVVILVAEIFSEVNLTNLLKNIFI